ncbi:NAD(P)/FAD-dependent oxidoreductase [Actinospica sp.]|jgi:phytoene dehydrogenase-like protein|uniref:phytoene desaturase family protein n=1 Tax=Actinospica sp. TaxID=1872142 RepID=UPI002BEBD3CE|nr:NAD(P)/FAD-dependent oxidoreductase [Actinospica sp.]HWG22640.1 NAD(P)/FAD-dependent oxidoreductase [Actinospica sp.]
MADAADERYQQQVPDATDVVVLGAGHNGLVTAAYLARFGLRVTLLERLDHVGGAAVSEQMFPGIEARLSAFSYLVALMPYAVVRDLELDLELRSRPVASYTPVLRGGRADGLLVERRPGPATVDSFRRVTGSDRDWRAWQRFYEQIGKAARVIAPTMLEPMPGKGVVMKAVREACGSTFWHEFMEEPLGTIVDRTFEDDDVRGIVLTDALIGTQTWAYDPTLIQNRCFLYHVMASASGEWRVPIGGMGAVTDSLERAAVKAGAVIRTGATVTLVESDGRRASVLYRTADGEHRIDAKYVAANVAPPILTHLLGRDDGPPPPEGNQLKVNLVVDRLPRLRSGIPAETAFAGTLHVDESATRLAAAYQESESGRLPDPLPFEAYCHTLTDRTILSPKAARGGIHTITLFGLHTPARLFKEEGAKDRAVKLALAGLNRYLEEPIEECLTIDAEGNPCIEALSPLDIEAKLAMPGGHIFHGDLSWPWATTGGVAGTWGVETQIPNVVLCGSGALRGGAVSGIPGRAAALSIVAQIQRTRGRELMR